MLFAVSLTLVAAVVSASPVKPQDKITALPLKHVSNISSVKNIVQKGQARIQKCNGNPTAQFNKDASSGAVTNDDVSYVAPVKIGSGTWELIVDTGCMLLPTEHLEYKH